MYHIYIRKLAVCGLLARFVRKEMLNMNIIITGASRGIGAAIAKALACENNNIMINCVNNVDKLNSIKAFVENKGGRCITYQGDVSDYDTCKRMADYAHKAFGSIDALINNAGISVVGLFQDLTPDEWNTIWNTNVSSVFNCCHAVIPHMLHEKSGRIINISSVWGNAGASCEVAYSATKGAVNSMTRALAKELAPSNIQVNAIACGAIDTDMNSHLSPDDKQALADEIPVGRFGSPDEIGQVAAQLLCSPAYLTGQIITVDGAWL